MASLDANLSDLWEQRKRLHKKRVQLPQDWFWDTNMAAGLFFWDTNMAAVTSCDGNLCTNIIVSVAYGVIHLQIVQYGIV